MISTNCMTGPAEILAENYEEASGRQEYQDAEYGILIPCLDPEKNLDASVITEEEEALAGQMMRLIEDEELYLKYREASCRRAAQFSSASYAETLRQMIEQDEKR